MKINIQLGGRGYGRAYRLIRKYEKAKDIFNKKYENKYQIRLFQDLQCLNIYLDILQEKKRVQQYQILNAFINNLTIKEIVKAYEELI